MPDLYQSNTPTGTGFFNPREIWELAVAWTILSLAFTILYSQTEPALAFKIFPACMATAGLGFLLHEIGHKYVALRKGYTAQFRANYKGLLIALVLSLGSFIYVSPGAVRVYGKKMDGKDSGRISMMGPLINILLSAAFLAIHLSHPQKQGMIYATTWLGYNINAWIGLFNMLPAGSFDGKKILQYNKTVYLMMAAAAAGLYITSYLI